MKAGEWAGTLGGKVSSSSRQDVDVVRCYTFDDLTMPSV